LHSFITILLSNIKLINTVGFEFIEMKMT